MKKYQVHCECDPEEWYTGEIPPRGISDIHHDDYIKADSEDEAIEIFKDWFINENIRNNIKEWDGESVKELENGCIEVVFFEETDEGEEIEKKSYYHNFEAVEVERE